MIVDDQQALRDRIAALETQLQQKDSTEKQLTLSMSLLTAAIEATADGILIVDNFGKVVRYNQRFVALWGIPSEILASQNDERLLGYVVDQLVSPVDFLAKVKSLYVMPLAESFDVLAFKDGRTFERYSRPQLLGTESVGRVWSFRDVTARIEAEQEAVRSRTQELMLAAQAATLAALSSPLIPISSRVMVMPLSGAISEERAGMIRRALITGMADSRARVAIIDVTGVSEVDRTVADTLVRAARAVKLLGAEIILTGVQPAVAQTLVDLELPLRGVVTRGTLQAGIGYALGREL